MQLPSTTTSTLSCSIRSIKFNHRRLHSRLHAGWQNVGGASILLFIRRIRFVLHFSAVAHLYNGKQCIEFSSFSTILMKYLLFFLQMNGDTIVNALKVQVLHYTIQSSLFDIVFVALIRFLLLIMFYGVFSINHWIVIAVNTTSITKNPNSLI